MLQAACPRRKIPAAPSLAPPNHALTNEIHTARNGSQLFEAPYCLATGGLLWGAGAGATGSGHGVVPRSSEADAQSPAQSLVPLTVPTSLLPIGGDGLTCFTGLPPLGAAV